MFRKIKKFMAAEDIGIREKFFRIILYVGLLLTIITFFFGMSMDNFKENVVALTLLPLCLIFAIILTVKYKKMTLAAALIQLVVFCGMMPITFFSNGGVHSGSPIWYVFGILYCFLMFQGRQLIVYLLIMVSVYGGSFVLAYTHLEMLVFITSEAEIYMDVFMGMLLVSIPTGILIQYQVKLLDKNQKITVEQKEELEKLAKSKDVFFANMSHEIRTPINTIIGLNEMILREDVSDEVRENAINVKSASNMLLSIVNDILDFSGLGNGKMELINANYETKNMFSDLVNIIGVRMQEKKLQFNIDIDEHLPSVMYGDEKRIKQILINILSNAVKYTDTGSVTFTAWGQKTDDNRLVLRVSIADTGIGIKQEDIDTLYDTFKRVNSERNAKIEGNGLGLAITKQLVELMGGTIGVDSIYMKGTEFVVKLEQDIVDTTPIGVCNFALGSEVEDSTYHQSFEAPEARVLFVDDNDTNLMVVKKLLRATKIKIDVAKTGEECLEKTKEKTYDIIVLDYMLPDYDGRTMLKAIRTQENGLCRNTPLIAFSAAITENNIQTFMDNGFDGCLSKPVDPLLLEAEMLKFIPEELIEYREVENKADDYSEDNEWKRRRKHRKILITTDCVCDLPREVLEREEIKMMYLYIQTESGIFQDTKEMDVDMLEQFLSDKDTSIRSMSAPVEDFERFFADALTEAIDVIHIAPAEHVGVTYKRASEAAKGFAHVSVIDSGNISGGQGIIALHAARLVREGYSVNEIKEEIARIRDRIELYFLMPSVNIFYKYGFTDRITAKLCNILRAHPVVDIKRSHMRVSGVWFNSVSTARRHFIAWRARRKKKIDSDLLIITHVCCTVREQREILREVNKHFKFKEIIIQKACVSNACNAGVGTIGLAFMTKEKND